MKKITMFIAAVLAVACTSKNNNQEAVQAEEVQVETTCAAADSVEIAALEYDFTPSESDGGTGYAYKWVSFATDFAEKGKSLDATYDGLALTIVGEPYQFRFQVESFDADGNAKDNISSVYWLTGEHSGTEPVLATLDSATVKKTYKDETTVVFQLPAEITERFADGNAGMHIHFGDQGSAGDMVISKAVLFQTKK
ncbi:MAG: hypothetical protein E7076_06600 [Bacteroidales bacterium]|jgi:hypothetical protein|nr:hypothetical protein [Bacteroidales bacterium]MBP5135560.1 hypothetical protein [Paludibacteraceae bacterium]MDD6357867.1 hypothetical protein [Bacteroidales bacterium]